jgi:RNA polymerase sigma-70 factor, ECF subfamily
VATAAKWFGLISVAVDGQLKIEKAVELGEQRGDAKGIADLMAASIAHVASSKHEPSFEILFRYFAPRIKSYFMRLGADVSTAEEVTQETMVQVWRNAGQYDRAKASVATWIFTLARNLSIDTFRRTRRPQFDPNDAAFIPDGQLHPDHQLERAETDQRVRQVMESLSANEKSVLMLSFYENCSHGEISQRLGIPLGTVKSRIRLASAKVRSSIVAGLEGEK